MVVSNSWFSRLRASFGSVLFGGMLALVGFPLLFWNEGRAVKTAKSLEEGARSVVSIDANEIDPDNEGALVHVIGEARPSQALSDATLGISELAIRLQRTVEMFQWKEQEETETRETADGKKEQVTKYSYAKVWASQPIDSSQFHEAQEPKNPPRFPFGSETLWANDVRLGAFRLNEAQVKQLGGSTRLAISPEMLASLPRPFADIASIQDDAMYLHAEDLARISIEQREGAPSSAQDDSDNLSRGQSDQDREVDDLIRGVEDAPTKENKDRLQSESVAATEKGPSIGDVRVRLEVIRPQEISLIARQSGDSFQPFQTKAGRQIWMQRSGSVSAESMFEQARSVNRFFTWALRIIGFVIMFFGVLLVFRPLTVVADAVPMVGGILQFGVAFVALVIAAPLALITIAIAWIFFRPLFALGLLALAVGIVIAAIWLIRMMRGKEDPKMLSQL